MIDPLSRRSALFGWLASLALHALVVALAAIALVPPDSGFEFQIPVEVELGLADATEVEVAAPSAPSVPDTAEPPPAASAATDDREGPRAIDAGVIADAGAGDAGARRRRDAGVDAGADETAPGIGAGAPVAFLPAGAQLALRVDMDRVRGSPIGDDVASMLRVVPDWRALLGESGVDPVRDLSRILIATPNLQRASIVVAGRLSESAPAPREVASRIAASQGVELGWRDVAGVPSTSWPSLDGIQRDVALVGDRHFVIARPGDLPRVLAIAAARRGRRAEVDPADALLSMGPGEGLSVEVENVAVFVRRSPCAVPRTLRAGVVEAEGGVDLRGEARFESAELAEEAAACLGERARAFASNLIVSLYGLAGPLERLELRADGATLHLSSHMTYAELRTITGLVRGLFDRPPPGGATGGAPPPPTAPPPPPLPPSEPPPSPFE